MPDNNNSPWYNPSDTRPVAYSPTGKTYSAEEARDLFRKRALAAWAAAKEQKENTK